MKKSATSHKSNDIRSYFKAFSSSSSQSAKPSTKPSDEPSSSSKRKAVVLSDTDEEDFSKTKKEAKPSTQTASSAASSHKERPSKASKAHGTEKNESRSSSVAKSKDERVDKSSQKSRDKKKADDQEEVSLTKISKTSSSVSPEKSKHIKTNSSPSPQRGASLSVTVKDEEPAKHSRKLPETARSNKEESSSKAKASSKSEKPKVKLSKAGITTSDSGSHSHANSKSSAKDSKPEVSESSSPAKGVKRSAHGASRSTEAQRKEASMPPPSKKKSTDSSPNRSRVNVTPPNPTRKSQSSDVETPETTPGEKKRNTASYFKFLSRGPPPQLGSKEFPEGAANCLENLTFVITGVLTSFERDDVVDKIKEYGGRVTGSVSKKTSYVIAGNEPGESKTKKAAQLGVPQISEDQLLEMIRKSNPTGSASKKISADQEMEIEDRGNESLFENTILSEESDHEQPVPSKIRAKISQNESVFEKSILSDIEEPIPSKLRKTHITPMKRFEDFHDFDSDLETPPKVREKRNQHSSSATKNKQPCSPLTKSEVTKARRPVSEARKLFDDEDEGKPSPSKTLTKAAPSTPPKASNVSSKSVSPQKKPHVTASPSSSKSSAATSSSTSKTLSAAKTCSQPPAPLVSGPPALMWVDKYKPASLKQVVGQAGDSSNAKKLLRWLSNWFNYHGSASDKAKASWPGLRDPEGKTFKAALLSGPPGIGKTTTGHLCCKELNYNFIEMNASVQRNKKGLQEKLSDCLSNMALNWSGTAVANNKSKEPELNRKHVLIMDEVDGMSGNEDRGGVQELIALIKSSRIPIICICNDRNHPKIRSLANYCFDLRFTKPRNEQLKSFVQSICFKEKIKVPPENLQQLIISTDQDIRQILHQLQMFTESKSKNVYDPRKDLRLGPWDVARKVFSAQDHQGMTLNDKASLFFHDYSIGPLFVQENYLRWTPRGANGDPYKTMDLVKSAAECLAIGDRVDNLLRRSNNWSLLPVQAIFSSVLPGEYMEGFVVSGIDFPQWLGKNSNRNKRARLLQQLHTHVHLHVSGNMEALNMDYLPYLRRSIVNPLVNGDTDSAVEYMTNYSLLREDLDNINELALWPNMRDHLEKLDSKSKAAFTRQVNKESFVPYSVVKVTKARGKAGAGDPEDELEKLEGDEEGAAAEDEDQEEEDVEHDAMIKVKKSKAKAGSSKAGSSKAKATTEKGKRGKGKSKDSDIEEDSDEDEKPKKKSKKGSSRK